MKNITVKHIVFLLSFINLFFNQNKVSVFGADDKTRFLKNKIFSSEVFIIDSVPKSFEKGYQTVRHEYNPLHVGDYWQYYTGDDYIARYIEKDTLVGSQVYFKKNDYRYRPRLPSEPPDYYYNWERNDTLKQSTYMLDWEDLDEDGDTTDELLLDSMEVPVWTFYDTYRYCWKEDQSWDFPITAHAQDSCWIFIFGDTVMARYVEYMFYADWIADKYGVVGFFEEYAPFVGITGAIINGVQYGNIVSVEADRQVRPKGFLLYNNYPNPFNGSTKIDFQLSKSMVVTLKVFNSLGAEIKTLCNEYKNPGNYSVIFNAENLASGIYYYQLKGSTLNVTKKMILLR